MKQVLERLKDPVSGLMHLLSAFAACIGAVLLILNTPQGSLKTAMLIYGVTLVALFLSSSAYHLIRTTPHRELLLRKIDHCAIYIFIAGTYTPVCIAKLSGSMQTFLLVAIWAVAFAGVGAKIFIMAKKRWLTAGIYVLMGWMCLIAIKPLLESLSSIGLFWLVLGGLFYTFGALVYATKSFDFYPGKFGFHEVWHLFVSAGAAAHFALVYGFIES